MLGLAIQIKLLRQYFAWTIFFFLIFYKIEIGIFFFNFDSFFFFAISGVKG